VITKRLLVAGMLVVLVGLGVHAGPAQDVLSDLAESAYNERIATGIATIGVGVAVGVASGLFLMGTDLGVYGLIAGGIIAAPGVVLLLLPSSSEREFAQFGDSETDSAMALARLADEGRRSRFLSGVGNVATGIATLVYPFNVVTSHDSLYSSVASFGMAVYDFLIPSREEAAYDRYRMLVGQGI
jgi:hypothetical protein